MVDDIGDGREPVYPTQSAVDALALETIAYRRARFAGERESNGQGTGNSSRQSDDTCTSRDKVLAVTANFSAGVSTSIVMNL